jgi:hypothetical protein
MNSKKDWLLFSYRPTYKSLDDLNQEEMKLAGLRVNPITNISSTTTYINNLKIRKFNEKQETQVIGLPKILKLLIISWSPDEKNSVYQYYRKRFRTLDFRCRNQNSKKNNLIILMPI